MVDARVIAELEEIAFDPNVGTNNRLKALEILARSQLKNEAEAASLEPPSLQDISLTIEQKMREYVG